jgi:hypothetical protein
MIETEKYAYMCAFFVCTFANIRPSARKEERRRSKEEWMCMYIYEKRKKKSKRV